MVNKYYLLIKENSLWNWHIILILSLEQCIETTDGCHPQVHHQVMLYRKLRIALSCYLLCPLILFFFTFYFFCFLQNHLYQATESRPLVPSVDALHFTVRKLLGQCLFNLRGGFCGKVKELGACTNVFIWRLKEEWKDLYLVELRSAWRGPLRYLCRTRLGTQKGAFTIFRRTFYWNDCIRFMFDGLVDSHISVWPKSVL